VAGDAARLDPENAQAVAHRARALAGLHRFDDAIAACDAWLGARGPNVFVLEAKADAALAAGRVVLAREVADALLARSEDAPAILLQGLLAEVAGDSSRGAVLARDAARTAASGGMLPHEIARFHVAAGEMACRAGRSAEAKSDFDLALTACRDHAGALGGLADLAAAEGRLPEARELAGRAAAQRPAPRELFRVSLLGGIEAEAYAADVRATAMCEANPGLFGRELAEHLAARNADLERALRSIDADLAVRADPEGHALRARILLALGRLDDAAAAVAASRRFGTRTPSVLHTAARVAARRGETATARSVVAELESISPSLVPPDLRAFAGAAR
jgi:tetratricopeptide (TPR) repeat protein